MYIARVQWRNLYTQTKNRGKPKTSGLCMGQHLLDSKRPKVKGRCVAQSNELTKADSLVFCHGLCRNYLHMNVNYITNNLVRRL
jgi:hypothetical protein